MAVRRRNTRIEMRARTVLGRDIGYKYRRKRKRRRSNIFDGADQFHSKAARWRRPSY
jgi:hypothetical protein